MFNRNQSSDFFAILQSNVRLLCKYFFLSIYQCKKLKCMYGIALLGKLKLALCRIADLPKFLKNYYYQLLLLERKRSKVKKSQEILRNRPRQRIVKSKYSILDQSTAFLYS